MRDSLTSHQILILFLNAARPLSGPDVLAATQIPSGTVYVLLIRFEEEKWIRQVDASLVATDGKRNRLYYALTAKGKAEAVRRRDQLADVLGAWA